MTNKVPASPKKINKIDIILPMKDVVVQCSCRSQTFGVHGLVHHGSSLKISYIRCLKCGKTLKIDDGVIASTGTFEQRNR